MNFPLLREPLLQFLVLGGALFGLYNLVGKKTDAAPAKIVVSSVRIANLADGFARTWQRQPSKEELQGLVDDYIRDEVFYREGRAAGLDRDDVVIRRRVDVLARTDAGVKATALGDPFLLGEEFHTVSQNDVARMFGESFAKRISVLEQGRWQGPISSAFGQHFVFVSQRIPGSLPTLDAVRQAVRREWANASRVEAEQKLYGSLRARYEIVVEAQPAKATLAETGR